VTIQSASVRVDALREHLRALLQAVDHEEANHRAGIDAVLPKHRRSAANLAHYLGLRGQDILASSSSIGRINALCFLPDGSCAGRARPFGGRER